MAAPFLRRPRASGGPRTPTAPRRPRSAHLGCAGLRHHGHDAGADRCATGADPFVLGLFTVIELAWGNAGLFAAVDELAGALRDGLHPRTVIETRICRGAA